MGIKLILILGCLSCTGILFFRTQDIIGPVVFGDELLYFEMMKNFALSKTLITSQYGPLYPIVGSLFYTPESVFKFYERLRLFNLFVFSLSFFPLFLIARMQNISFISSFILAMICVLLPWSTLVPFIWAEPLFYFLYCWTFYLAFCCFQNKKSNSFLYLGTVSALLVLTKQLAIVFFIGFLLIQLIFAALNQEPQKKFLKKMSLFLLPHSLTFSFFIWNRMANPGAGLMGYGNSTSAIQTTLSNLLSTFPFYENILYQISYIFIATFGLPFLIFVFFCLSGKKIPYFQYQFNILISTVGLGICICISLFFNTFTSSYFIANEPTLTSGRYLAPLLPIILISSVSLLPLFRKVVSWKQEILLTLPFLLLLGLFSPLASVYSLGILNSQDTMFLSRWMGETFPPWLASSAHEWANHSAWKIVTYITFLLLLLRFSILSRPLFLAGLLYLSVTSSGVNNWNILYLGNFGKNEHQMIRHLMEHKIRLDDLYYDKTIDLLQFNYQFWFGSELGQAWYKSHSIKNFSQVPSSGWLVTRKNDHWTESKNAVFFGEYTLVPKTTP